MTLLFHPSKKNVVFLHIGNAGDSNKLGTAGQGFAKLKNSTSSSQKIEWENCGFVGRSILI